MHHYTFQRCTSQGSRLLFQGDVGGWCSIDEVHGPVDPCFISGDHLALKRFFAKLVTAKLIQGKWGSLPA